MVKTRQKVPFFGMAFGTSVGYPGSEGRFHLPAVHLSQGFVKNSGGTGWYLPKHRIFSSDGAISYFLQLHFPCPLSA